MRLPEILFLVERFGGELVGLHTNRIRKSARLPMLLGYPLLALRAKLRRRKYADLSTLHRRHLKWMLHRARPDGPDHDRRGAATRVTSATVPPSGFSIICNPVRYGSTVIQSLRSLLPLVEAPVVAVGRSEDQTLDVVRSGDLSRRLSP